MPDVLTSLAPEIVEAILPGEEPNGLSRAQSRGRSLRKLQRDLPVGWQEQRQRWPVEAG